MKKNQGFEVTEEILENINEAFISTDNDFTIKYINKAAEVHTQKSRDEVIDKNLLDAFPHIRNTSLQEKYEILLKERKNLEFEDFFNEPPYKIWFYFRVYPYNNGFNIFFQDITERKKSEIKLLQSEQNLRLKLDSIIQSHYSVNQDEFGNIIDSQEIQSLMDKFYEITNLPFAILDTQGNLLASTGWQDLCTNFHRLNKETCENCLEKDLEITKKLKQGDYRLYKCKNQIWNMVTPILVGNQHMGNLYMGQFFFDDHEIDYEKFKRQAEKFSYNQEHYFAALDKVPRWSRDYVDKVMKFYSHLAQMISRLSYRNLILAKTIQDYKKASSERDLFFNYSLELLTIADFKGYFKQVNPAWESTTGWSAEELLSRPYLDFIHPDDYEATLKSSNDLTEGKAALKFTNRFQCKDGSYRWLSWNSYSILEEKLVFASARDITDIINYEKAIKESEERYSLTIEAVNEGLWDWEIPTGKAYFSPTYYTMLGYEDKEFPASYSSFESLIHPDDLERVKNQLKEHINKSEGYTIDFRLRTKDNRWLWIQAKGKVVKTDENGNPVRMVGTHTDITQQKIAEEALKESRLKFKSIFENAGEAIILFDPTGKIIEANKMIEKLFGFSRDEFIGQKFEKFIPPLIDLNALSAFDDALKGKRSESMELLIKNRDGEKLTLIAHPSILKNDDDTIKGIIIILEDVTHIKQTEMELKQSLKDKNVLLSEIHHRVKNNMQIISSLLNLQSHHVDGDETRSVLKESQGRVKSMAMIHEKLYQSTDFSHINFGKYIEELVFDLFHTYGVNKAYIKPDIQVEDFQINLDTAIPCGLIINELVTNSLKYAFPNNKKGTVKVEFKSIGDEYLLIVSDDGIGLPENIQMNKRDTLGMQLVNSLIEQLEGELELDRTDGTTYKMKFKDVDYQDRI
ncbi:MAG: PAS domain S-box protein [Methanobacteriaceae archaeon]|nr:PAS domain S-box protein [Methanobacteriaceae archaeon]